MDARRSAAAGVVFLCLSFLLIEAFQASAQVMELKDAVERLAIQLTHSVPEGRTLRVAVTDFPDL